MKKKILAIALVVAMLAVAIVSASLAYFTDEDYATNTFTLGEIDIDLEEDFGNKDDKDGDGKPDGSEFYPGVDVTKKVWVENTSTTGNEAYIRVHVAFPVELAPREATKNGEGEITGYTYKITGEDGLAIVTANTTDWTWTDIYSADIGEEGGTIVPCVVYVATYNTSVEAGKKTTNAIDAVKLNAAADTDILKTEVVGDNPATAEVETSYEVDHLHLFMDLNNDGDCDENELRVDAQGTNPFTIDVEVAAEAVQIEGLGSDPAAALDTAFGDPGTYVLSSATDENDILWDNCETQTIVNDQNETVANPNFPSANP